MISEQQILDCIPRLRHAARRLSGNRLDAEDLLQETLIRCLRFRHGVEDANPIGWCLVVMRNQHYSMTRRPKLVSYWGDGLDDMQSVPDRHEDQVYVNQILDRVLKLTPERQQMIEGWVNGLDYGQIGQLMNCPTNTVKSRLSRTRAALLEE